MRKKFIRRDSHRYAKIGKGRKKLQVWRRPKGRDNKIREKRFSYPVSPIIGFKKPKSESGKIKGLSPVVVYTIKDIERAKKDSIIIIGKVGARKKIDLVKKADEMKFAIANISKEKAK